MHEQIANRDRFVHGLKWFGLVCGPVLAGCVYWVLPGEFENSHGVAVEFTPAGRATLAVLLWMGVWWMTEAVHVSVTALLPLGLFPLLGVANISEAAAPYGRDLIFLFMGGFILALSMQRWNLDRRIALMTLNIVGTSPNRMIAGFMIATAVMSAFVSNTATTAMMLPIALGVIALIDASEQSRDSGSFATCLMLGIAYAASIGGLATIIGTPPNVILVGFLRTDIAEEFQRDLSFARWMLVGVPLSMCFLPIAWLLLTRFIYPPGRTSIPGGRQFIRARLSDLGPMRAGEWATFVVFCMAVFCWITRTSLLAGIESLSDSGIAMLAALTLFVIPVSWKERTFVMDWQTAQRLPWGILILFGGGLSLASAVSKNGVAEFIGAQAAALQGLPPILIVLCVVTAIVFLTELTSNTATTSTLLPVLAGASMGLEIHPYLLCIPAALAASCAFMLPVATPPNAIVFSSDRITIAQMCKGGIWLNVIGVGLITLLAYTIIIPIFVR